MPEAQIDVTVTGWDENEYAKQGEPVRLAQADWPTQYAGDLTGTVSVRGLLTYTAGDAGDAASQEADWIGFERVTGELGGRSGSFVLRLAGTHSGGVARAEAQVVPDSGTGELAGLTGTARYEVSGMNYPMTLSYELP